MLVEIWDMFWVIFGGVFSYLLMAYLKKQNKKSVTERQSIVLLVSRPEIS